MNGKINPPQIADNKIVDFAAAAITGFAIWALEYLLVFAVPVIDLTQIRRLSVKVSAFALVSLILFPWRHKLRIHWGWILIATVGMGLTAAADEMIYRATSTAEELAFMPAFSPFPMEIVMWFVPALLIMASGHYVGRLVIQRSRDFY